jgi:uncharacterized membrane protein YccC
MTSRIQKQQAKKKAKEREDRKKILEKRAVLRKQAKEVREEFRRDKRIKRLQRALDDFGTRSKEELEELPDSTLNQLEKNAQILRALEQEYEKEQAEKKKLNESLEDQGHDTLDSKLKVLQERTVLQQQEKLGVGGSANCNFTIAPRQPKDTASVEVIKAPTEENP